MDPISFTIYGQAASKANSRQLVTIGGRPSIIKSKEARQFMTDARRQVPPKCRVRLQGPVAVKLRIYYASERPDLDESVVLDALQDHWGKAPDKFGPRQRPLLQPGVYCNDRQVRWKLVIHGIDRRAPRVEVQVLSIAPTQDLFTAEPFEPELPF
jgi:Holliday junction resolvase RusA-like endonuclease